MQLTLMSNRLFVESFMKIQYNDRPELLHIVLWVWGTNI